MKDSKGQPGSIHTDPTLWDSSWPRLLSQSERYNLISIMERRFGIPPSIFSEFLIFERKKGWWILKKSKYLKDAVSLKASVTGLKAFQKVGKYIKPTTRFIQLFGHLATKSVICLTHKQLFDLTAGEKLALNLGLEDGYVILKSTNNYILGIGLWTRGVLQSQIPKKEVRWSFDGQVITA